MIDTIATNILSLCLVSPCRDEMEHLARSVDSVLAQSVRPKLWVIVDDGSTDASSEYLDQLAAGHNWIRVVHTPPRSDRQLGGGVVRAFKQGLLDVDLTAFTYVCKLDLDLDLPSSYFELLDQRMRADERLASCSGKPYFYDPEGAVEVERCGSENSVGMTKFYRVSAYNDIGGFVEAVMWDGIDCHRARQLGWRSAAFDDERLAFEHLRPMGSSDRGIMRGRRRHGSGQYYMGSSFAFVVASALSRLRDYPAFLGSANMLAGYLGAAACRSPRFDAPGFRRALRRYQYESLVIGKDRAAERSQARGAKTTRQFQVAYLVSQYPAVSHTFIGTEIAALEEQGIAVQRFSVRDSARGLPATMHAERDKTTVVHSGGRLVVSLASAAALAPRKLLTLITDAVMPRHTAGLRDRIVRLGYVASATGVWKGMRTSGVTHLHAHFSNNASEIARMVCVIDPTLSWSFTVHSFRMNGLDHTTRQNWPVRNQGRWGPLVDKVREASFISCISENSRQRLLEIAPTIDPNKLVLVRMGFAPDLFDPQPRTRGGVPTVLYVGRLAVEKEPLVALQAFAGLVARRNARFVIVGTGHCLALMQAEVERLQIAEHVEFLGVLSQARLPEQYAAADLFLMTSSSEGIPVVLMEAFAMGVPVVAPDIDGIPELVVDGSTGLLVQPGDVDSFTKACDRLLSDGDLSARMGQRGRELVLAQHNAREQSQVLARALIRQLESQ